MLSSIKRQQFLYRGQCPKEIEIINQNVIKSRDQKLIPVSKMGECLFPYSHCRGFIAIHLTIFSLYFIFGVRYTAESITPFPQIRGSSELCNRSAIVMHRETGNWLVLSENLVVFQGDCAVIDSIWNSLTILETFVVYFMSFFVCSSRIFYFFVYSLC